VEYINLHEYPVNIVLDSLLEDKTTKRNIIFATNSYAESDASIDEKTAITSELLLGFDDCIIQPRVCKSIKQQIERTQKKAEVFTPSWICNKMNNHCDAEWFGKDGLFNTEIEQGWIVNSKKIPFSSEMDWQKYVDSKRLEITCGEAPYIVSRYDASTGELIDVKNRIGILDRKLRVVNENTDTEDEWLKWVIRAYQSVYGYEFQGDNLLIARINLLNTFVDYMQDRWGRVPTKGEIKKLTNIIVWNLWQMDGITGVIPYTKPVEDYQQINFFDFIEGEKCDDSESVDCRIFDWRSNESITYRSLKEGRQ